MFVLKTFLIAFSLLVSTLSFAQSGKNTDYILVITKNTRGATELFKKDIRKALKATPGSMEITDHSGTSFNRFFVPKKSLGNFISYFPEIEGHEVEIFNPSDIELVSSKNFRFSDITKMTGVEIEDRFHLNEISMIEFLSLLNLLKTNTNKLPKLSAEQKIALVRSTSNFIFLLDYIYENAAQTNVHKNSSIAAFSKPIFELQKEYFSLLSEMRNPWVDLVVLSSSIEASNSVFTGSNTKRNIEYLAKWLQFNGDLFPSDTILKRYPTVKEMKSKSNVFLTQQIGDLSHKDISFDNAVLLSVRQKSRLGGFPRFTSGLATGSSSDSFVPAILGLPGDKAYAKKQILDFIFWADERSQKLAQWWIKGTPKDAYGKQPEFIHGAQAFRSFLESIFGLPQRLDLSPVSINSFSRVEYYKSLSEILLSAFSGKNGKISNSVTYASLVDYSLHLVDKVSALPTMDSLSFETLNKNILLLKSKLDNKTVKAQINHLRIPSFSSEKEQTKSKHASCRSKFK